MATDYNWKMGETVKLPWSMHELKKSGNVEYAYQIWSRYICVRECAAGQTGLLVKSLGNLPDETIAMVGSEPFFIDDRNEGFTADQYLCFRFPDWEELREVLDIVRYSEMLQERFQSEQRPIRPDATYWVRNTMRRKLFTKRPAYYDPAADQIFTPTDDHNVHHRLTIVRFTPHELTI